mgnify:CR=1 FL=1
MNSVVIYNQSNGSVAYVIPCGDTPIDEVQRKDVPEGVESEIVERDKAFPVDEFFRDAWTWAGKGQPVLEDLAKSKAIAHNIRRTKRAEEFAPHDDVISKHIPGVDADAAEASRASIRTKYATMQSDIDVADSTAKIKVALGI